MASYHGNTNSEPAKNEQIITEFFAKSLHIILESRCPYVSSRNYSGEQGLSSPSSSSSSSSSIRQRDKWFNLALKDCPAALENIDFWRQSNLEPMVVDVVLVQRSSNWDPLNCSPKRALVRNLSSKERYYWNSEHDEFRNEVNSEKIIERWVLQYESRKGSNTGGGGSCGGGSGSKRWTCTSSHTLYKKSILLLRSLYVTVRLLPAYKLFRDLISSAQIGMYTLGHRVSSFVEPFTHREEAEMQRFVFAPVDTSCGRLCLSVLYRSSVSDVSSEPSTPMSPQFIPDYVGSPLADPLKRFPSASLPQGSPSLSVYGRRHSWSFDLYRASPPSGIPSPSPTYSESHATAKPRSHRLPPTSLPRHLPDETPQEHIKNTSYDEYWPSPNFSTSPSPSPPTHTRGVHVSRALLRSESAPVSIPASRPSGIPLLFHNQMLPPSPPSRPSKSSLAKTDGRSSLFQASSTVDKLFAFGKDDAGKLFGTKLSTNSSPQKSFSRSSSKLSFQDDYDDSEFSGPFVVDDVTDPGSRPGSFEQLGNPCGQNDLVGVSAFKKSQDAAVGALVCLLKKAPPLRQDLRDSTNLMHGSKPEILKTNVLDPAQISGQPGLHQSASMSFASSGLVGPKTTSDALEELSVYTEMKNKLLKQGGKSQT
ncbi:hypothetical protein ACH5RR_012641 [Cinchona calisaya]|uniref:Autophagy-related protein 13 N-terminal domain-containing protein n=1 Tax=Cinchona calisaya TaxID=153742 RepID=A0ABD3ABY3_9GENT